MSYFIRAQIALFPLLLAAQATEDRPNRTQKFPTTSEHIRALFSACKVCDAHEVDRLLDDAGSKVTALEQAELTKTTIAFCGDTKSGASILRGFAQHRFDFNYHTSGFPPLYLACIQAAKTCNLELVRVLLAAGADPHGCIQQGPYVATTAGVFMNLSKLHDCPPCTRKVAKLLPFEPFESIYVGPVMGQGNDLHEQERSSHSASSFERNEPQQDPASSDEDCGPKAQSFPQSSQGGSQEDRQHDGKGKGSSGSDWGSFLSDTWKNL